VGHQFKHYPFVGERLKQLLKDEMMNVHQHAILTTIIVLPNVHVQGIQIMNPSFGHMKIPISY
jgi:hypothetical protein